MFEECQAVSLLHSKAFQSTVLVQNPFSQSAGDRLLGERLSRSISPILTKPVVSMSMMKTVDKRHPQEDWQ